MNFVIFQNLADHMANNSGGSNFAASFPLSKNGVALPRLSRHSVTRTEISKNNPIIEDR